MNWFFSDCSLRWITYYALNEINVKAQFKQKFVFYKKVVGNGLSRWNGLDQQTTSFYIELKIVHNCIGSNPGKY